MKAIRMADTRLHWRTGDSLSQAKHTLCGLSVRKPGLRYQTAHVWQIKHALHSSADTCEDCRAFYERNKEGFDHEERRSGYISGLMAKHGLLDEDAY